MAPKHALLSSSGSGGSGVGGVNTKRDSRASSAVAWVLDTGMVAVCSPRTRALDGKLARCLVTAVLVLMLQSSMAADGKTVFIIQPVRAVPYSLLSNNKRTHSCMF